MCELSFTPASRLSSDSARSPICAATLTSAPNASAPDGAAAKVEMRRRMQHGARVQPRDEHARRPARRRALDRLSRAHRRNQLAPPDRAADRVRADVRRPRQQHRQQQQQPARRDGRTSSTANGERRRSKRIFVISNGVAVAEHAAGVGHAERGRRDGAQRLAVDAAHPDRRARAARAARAPRATAAPSRRIGLIQAEVAARAPPAE